MSYKVSEDIEAWLTEEPLKHCVTLYLPSKKNNGRRLKAARKKLIRAAMEFLLRELGGATLCEGTGYFLDSTGVMHQEKVTLCRSFCSEEILLKNRPEIISLANSFAIEFQQASIAVEIDEMLFFYEPNDNFKELYRRLSKKWAKGKGVPLGYKKYISLSKR